MLRAETIGHAHPNYGSLLKRAILGRECQAEHKEQEGTCGKVAEGSFG
jgi:hypothetical protein